MIRFSCSRCGKKIRGPERAAGSKMFCPRCGERLLIPPPVREESIHAQPQPTSANTPAPVPARLPAQAARDMADATSSEWEMPPQPRKNGRLLLAGLIAVLGLTVAVLVLALVMISGRDPAVPTAPPAPTPGAAENAPAEDNEPVRPRMDVEIPNKHFVPPPPRRAPQARDPQPVPSAPKKPPR